MSIPTESKALVKITDSELPSDRKNSVIATDTNLLNDESPIKASPTHVTTIKPTFTQILRPRFFRLQTTPQVEESPTQNGEESPKRNDQSPSLVTLKSELAKSLPVNQEIPKDLSAAKINSSESESLSPKQIISSQNEKKSFLDVAVSKIRGSLSANISPSSSPRAHLQTRERRKSGSDFSKAVEREEGQIEGENDGEGESPIVKKPGTNFGVEHFKLLRQRVESETMILEKDIQEAVDAKNKRGSALTLSVTSSKKWEKAKANVLALARLKRLKDDIRLWGTNAHIPGPNADNKGIKLLMPENQFDASPTHKKHKRFMVYPYSKFAVVWYIIYLHCMIYTAVVTPYRIAFLEDLVTSWKVVEYIIDVIFFCDILITLNSAKILESGHILDNRKEIFLSYMKGWLIVDLIAIFPFQLFISETSGGKGNDYNDLLKLVRLPRLYKFTRTTKVFQYVKKIKRNKYFQNIQDTIQINISTLRISKFLVVLLLSVHLFACLWYLAAKIYRFREGTWVYEVSLVGESNFALYITCVYWVVSTLTTVGFGDIHAFNDLEKIISIIWIIIGVGFYSLNIGAMTSMLANKDTREGNLSAKLVLMDEFAKETGLPKDLRLKIKRTLEYNSLRNVFNQYERNEFFDEIPIDVKSEMAEVMHRGVITKLKFFQNKDRVFIATMVPLLQPLKISKGETIYLTGEYPINIYFIISGRVNIVVGAHMLNLKTYVQGSYFGEIEMVNNTVRQSTVRAEMDCELLTLSRKAFLRLMEDFPTYQDEMRVIAEERQLRIAEALRKIRQLLPISSSSKFWEKNRKQSLYDLDDINKIRDLKPSSLGDNDKPYATKIPSKFSEQQPKSINLQHQGSLESKIDEAENEDDEEEVKVKVTIPRQILEKKGAQEKIAGLINAQELKEEESKIARWITQMQNSRAGPSGTQLTETQLRTKLLQAEGDNLKKKSVLIVKGAGSTTRKSNASESSRALSPSKKDLNNLTPPPRLSQSSAVNVSVENSDQNPANRRSYFSNRSNNLGDATPNRRSLSIKAATKVTPKKSIGGLINRIFETPKSNDIQNAESVGSEEILEEKIDVLEIPTKVIENFNQKLIQNRSMLSQASSETPEHHSGVTPALSINRGRSSSSTSKFSRARLLSTEEKLQYRNSLRVQNPDERRMTNHSLSPGPGGNLNDIERRSEDTPRKILVVSGTSFDKKSKEDTPKSANDDDEIPDIAVGLMGPSNERRKFRLSIYEPPKTEVEVEKVLKSVWGPTVTSEVKSIQIQRNESAHSDTSGPKIKEFTFNNIPGIPGTRRREQSQYKINIIAPESASSIDDRPSSASSTQKKSNYDSDTGKNTEQPIIVPIRKTSSNFRDEEEKPVSRKSSFNNQNEYATKRPSTFKRSQTLEFQANTDESSETPEILSPLREAPSRKGSGVTIRRLSLLQKNSTLNSLNNLNNRIVPAIIVTTDNQDQNQSQDQENKDLSIIVSQKEVSSAGASMLENTTSLDHIKPENLKAPALELISEEGSSQNTSPVSLNDNQTFFSKLIASHDDNSHSQGDQKSRDKDLHGSKTNVGTEAKSDTNDQSKGEESRRVDDLTFDPKRNSERRVKPPSLTIPKNRKTLIPDPTIEVIEEKDKEAGQEDEVKSQRSKKSFTRKNKQRKKSKVEQNRYKHKYKKQSQCIEDLLFGFKKIKAEFGNMEKDVESIQNRLDSFEKLIDSFEDLMTRFTRRVSEQKKKSYQTSPSIEKILEKSPELEPAWTPGLPTRSDQASSTIYLPTKKTIVFTFQKPEVKTIKLSGSETDRFEDEEDQGGFETERKLLKKSYTFASQDNLISSFDPPESPVKMSIPDISPFTSRVSRLRMMGSKSSSQVLRKGTTYTSDDDEIFNFIMKDHDHKPPPSGETQQPKT